MPGNETGSSPTLPQLITFYSFKGGVGRSLALVNCALLLASYGRRVLAVDMDLEAPSLSRIEPFFDIPLERPGMLEVLERLLMEVPLQGGGTWLARPEGDALPPLHLGTCIHDVAIPEELNPAKGGRLCLMPAGAQDAQYAPRVEALRIGALYEAGVGYALARGLRELLREQPFDYVLIDARTGWSDIGGMCTRDLADQVVLLCGLNEQNLTGMKMVLEAIRTRRADQPSPSPILVASPVPTSEELEKKIRLKRFEALLGAPPVVQLPYHPLLALHDLPFVVHHPDELISGRYRELARMLLVASLEPTLSPDAAPAEAVPPLREAYIHLQKEMFALRPRLELGAAMVVEMKKHHSGTLHYRVQETPWEFLARRSSLEDLSNQETIGVRILTQKTPHTQMYSFRRHHLPFEAAEELEDPIARAEQQIVNKKKLAHLTKVAPNVLHPREQEVFRLMLEGQSSQEIAEGLGLSLNQVHVMDSRIRATLLNALVTG